MKGISGTFSVSINAGNVAIHGDLSLPEAVKGTVIFAHGSGSSRHSTRNKYVAEILNRAGFATLLIDLLTVEEETDDLRTTQHRFDIRLLAERLVAATDWTRGYESFPKAPLGYFGASTGAAAALVAAAQRPEMIQAIVSRGGRPDLAADHLGKVAAPTLFIVGEFDRDVTELNRQAALSMKAPTEIRIVPGATHLFEEEGALETAAALACGWFEHNLARRPAA